MDASITMDDDAMLSQAMKRSFCVDGCAKPLADETVDEFQGMLEDIVGVRLEPKSKLFVDTLDLSPLDLSLWNDDEPTLYVSPCSVKSAVLGLDFVGLKMDLTSLSSRLDAVAQGQEEMRQNIESFKRRMDAVKKHMRLYAAWYRASKDAADDDEDCAVNGSRDTDEFADAIDELSANEAHAGRSSPSQQWP